MSNIEGGQTAAKELGSGIEAENIKVRESIHKIIGWHNLGIEISKFTNSSFFYVMELPALEVAGLVTLMIYSSMINK